MHIFCPFPSFRQKYNILQIYFTADLQCLLIWREISFYVGLTFIRLSILLSFYSILQHKTVIASLQPAEIPKGYNLWGAAIVNGIVGVLGIILACYIYYGFKL